jgi:hypothetical protein
MPEIAQIVRIASVTERPQTVSGTVEFIWESNGELLLNLEPDRPGAPHTFEIGRELRRKLATMLNEGDRIEVEFVAVEHEVVDPDSGPAETLRAEVRDVRLLRGARFKAPAEGA